MRNAHEARRPEHHCRILIRARIVWDDTGQEQWIDTVAAGWAGPLVYVDAAPLRRAGDYLFNYVWLHARDVKRR